MNSRLASLVVLFASVGGAFGMTINSVEKVRTLNAAYSIKQSIAWFEKDCGRLPPDNPKSLLLVLQGQNLDENNQRKVVYWEPDEERGHLWWRIPGSLNEAGELIDGWGTPFRWKIQSNQWLLISAGKNAVFEKDGEGDDIQVEVYRKVVPSDPGDHKSAGSVCESAKKLGAK